MKILIIDVEATCWDPHIETVLRHEIIEIGAVIYDDNTQKVLDRFSSIVKPALEPDLSFFCKNLTSINQEMVDAAKIFPEVIEDFKNSILSKHAPTVISSWGDYDPKQIRSDCKLHGIDNPFLGQYHFNIKKAFARWKRVRPCGMAKALQSLNISLQGTHHRALDDVLNITKILETIPKYYISTKYWKLID